MADLDDLYAGMKADDDLSTALGTEPVADKDMVPAEFENPATSWAKSAETLPVEVYERWGYLRVERSRYAAATLRMERKRQGLAISILAMSTECARESSAAQSA